MSINIKSIIPEQNSEMNGTCINRNNNNNNNFISRG